MLKNFEALEVGAVFHNGNQTYAKTGKSTAQALSHDGKKYLLTGEPVRVTGQGAVKVIGHVGIPRKKPSKKRAACSCQKNVGDVLPAEGIEWCKSSLVETIQSIKAQMEAMKSSLLDLSDSVKAEVKKKSVNSSGSKRKKNAGIETETSPSAVSSLENAELQRTGQRWTAVNRNMEIPF